MYVNFLCKMWQNNLQLLYAKPTTGIVQLVRWASELHYFTRIIFAYFHQGPSWGILISLLHGSYLRFFIQSLGPQLCLPLLNKSLLFPLQNWRSELQKCAHVTYKCNKIIQPIMIVMTSKTMFQDINTWWKIIHQDPGKGVCSWNP